MGLIRTLCKGDKVVWLIFTILCIISIIEVFSATSRLTYGSDNHWGPITRHCLYLAIGVAALMVMHKMSYMQIRKIGVILYPISAALLAYVTVRGMVINGASRWIEIAGITFQPSELAKLSIIIIVSIILTWHTTLLRENKEYVKQQGFKYLPFWCIIGLTGFISLLIFRENISTAALLCLVVYLMMFIGRIPGKLMLAVTAVAGMAVIAVIAIVLSNAKESDETETAKQTTSGVKLTNRSETGKNRLIDFFMAEKVPPEEFDLDNNGQVAHANMAIASSHLIGCTDKGRTDCKEMRQTIPLIPCNGAGFDARDPSHDQHVRGRRTAARDRTTIATDKPWRNIHRNELHIRRNNTQCKLL